MKKIFLSLTSFFIFFFFSYYTVHANRLHDLLNKSNNRFEEKESEDDWEKRVASEIETLLCRADARHIVNAQDNQGQTPLHLAVEQGYTRIVESLINDERVDIYARDNNQRTPLHIALNLPGTRSTIVNLLLTRIRNDIRLGNKVRKDYVQDILDAGGYFRQIQNSDTIHHLLLTQPDNYSTEDWENEILAKFRELLNGERGIYLGNERNGRGQTPLHVAILRGYARIAEQLIENTYIDIYVPDDNRRTPLHLTLLTPQRTIENLLLTRIRLDIQHNNAVNFNHVCDILDANGQFKRTSSAGSLYALFHTKLKTQSIEDWENEYIEDFLKILKENSKLFYSQDQTPLHAAISRGYIRIVEALISNQNVDIYALDNNGRTPLHIASMMGRVDVVEQLLARHELNLERNKSLSTSEYLNMRDNTGHTPISLIASCILDRRETNASWEQEQLQTRRLQITRILLSYSINSNANATNLLHTILSSRHRNFGREVWEPIALEFIFDIINREPNENTITIINGTNRHGETPLHSAINQGYLLIAQTLINNPNTNIYSTDGQSRTAFHLAFSSNRLNEENRGYVIESFLARHALNSRQSSTVDPNYNINTPDCHGHTPLYLTIRKALKNIKDGQPYNCDIIFSLISEGANFGAQDKEHGNTIFHLICLVSRKEAIEILNKLIEHPATRRSEVLNIRNSAGETPLHIAARLGNYNAAQVLIQHGINTNILNIHSQTAAQVAITNGNLEIAELMLNLNSSSDSDSLVQYLDNDEEIDLLHTAVVEGALSILNLLISNHEYTDLTRVSNGNTPLHTLIESIATLPPERIVRSSNSYRSSPSIIARSLLVLRPSIKALKNANGQTLLDLFASTLHLIDNQRAEDAFEIFNLLLEYFNSFSTRKKDKIVYKALEILISNFKLFKKENIHWLLRAVKLLVRNLSDDAIKNENMKSLKIVLQIIANNLTSPSSYEYESAFKIAILLLQKGADPDVEVEIEESETGVLCAFISKVHLLTGENRELVVEMLKILLRSEIDVNIQDDNGDTPLQIIIRNFCLFEEGSESIIIDLIELLLERKARVCVQDHLGQTPLHSIISILPSLNEGQLKYAITIIEMLLKAILLEYMPNIDIEDLEGNTPLHILASNLHMFRGALRQQAINAMSLLLEHRSSENKENNNEKGRPLTVNADPNFLNIQNLTPLQIIISNFHLFGGSEEAQCAAEAVKLLLEYGANPDVMDSQGYTPIITAINLTRDPLVQSNSNTNSLQEIVIALLDRNPNLNIGREYDQGAFMQLPSHIQLRIRLASRLIPPPVEPHDRISVILIRGPQSLRANSVDSNNILSFTHQANRRPALNDYRAYPHSKSISE